MTLVRELNARGGLKYSINPLAILAFEIFITKIYNNVAEATQEKVENVTKGNHSRIYL